MGIVGRCGSVRHRSLRLGVASRALCDGRADLLRGLHPLHVGSIDMFDMEEKPDSMEAFVVYCVYCRHRRGVVVGSIGRLKEDAVFATEMPPG